MCTHSHPSYTLTKHTTTQHTTRRSSGVAPRACVRVYARVLVPPNLYIHTCPYIQHTTHTCTQAQLKHTNTHTHTQPHPTPPTHLQHVRDTDVCRHQYRKRCAPTRRDALHNLLIYTYVYSSYMSCAWPGVCCATSTAAALARRVRR